MLKDERVVDGGGVDRHGAGRAHLGSLGDVVGRRVGGGRVVELFVREDQPPVRVAPCIDLRRRRGAEGQQGGNGEQERATGHRSMTGGRSGTDPLRSRHYRHPATNL